VLWGLIAAALLLEAAAVWHLGRRWVRGAAVVLGGGGFLLALFVFFGFVSAALPASF
jgi:hypothetical protein